MLTNMYTSPRNTKYEKPLFSGNRPLHKSLYIKLKHPSLPYYRSSLIRIKWSIKEHDIRYLTYWRTKNSCIGGRYSCFIFIWKSIRIIWI